MVVENKYGAVMSDAGDSGGPVYTPQQEAVGIVKAKGMPGTKDENKLFFMAIDQYAHFGLGIISESFKVTSVPVNWRFTMNRPREVPIYFDGFPRFPVKITVSYIQCPDRYNCKESKETKNFPQPSPLKIQYVCSGLPLKYPMEVYAVIGLEDATGKRSNKAFNFSCM